MKKIVIVIVFYAFPLIVMAQNANPNTSSNVNESINNLGIEKKAEFPGGIEEFYKYLGDNFVAPTNKEFPGGNLLTSFVIEKDGSITDIKVLQDIGFGTTDEVVRVLKSCPLWIPAEQNGEKVRFIFTLPLTLQPPTLPDENVVYELEEIEVFPEYNGGMNKFYEFVRDNFKFSEEFERSGQILLSFVIDVDGSLTDIKLLNDLGNGSGEEAIRVLKKSGKWKPGEINGKPVKCAFMIPITIHTTVDVVYPDNYQNYFPIESRPVMYAPR